MAYRLDTSHRTVQQTVPSAVRPPRATGGRGDVGRALRGSATSEAILSRMPLRRRLAAAWRIIRRRPTRPTL